MPKKTNLEVLQLVFFEITCLFSDKCDLFSENVGDVGRLELLAAQPRGELLRVVDAQNSLREEHVCRMCLYFHSCVSLPISKKVSDK